MDTEPLTRGSSVLWLHPSYASSFRRAGLASVEDFLGAGELLRRKGPKENRVLRLPGEEPSSPLVFYLKIHRRGRGREGIREWDATRAVRAAGLPTPVPAAAGRCRHASFFCSAALDRALPLDDLLRTRPPAPGPKRALAEDLGRLAARLHRAGLFHRDFYLCHVFATPDPAAPPRLHLIDLQRVLRPRVRSRRWAVKDLAALHYSSLAVTVSDLLRLRALRRYLRERGWNTRLASHRRLLRAVLRKSARIARHDRKGGRP